MSWLRRREIIILITAVVSIITLANYYVNVPIIADLAKVFLSYAIILSQFAISLGVVRFLKLHSDNIIKKKPNQWYWSVYLIGLFAVFTASGLIPPMQKNALYQWAFVNVKQWIESAIQASLAFWMLSAAYRTFKMRNIESSLLLVSSMILICKNTPAVVNMLPFMTDLGNWIMSVPNTAAFRAFLIGVAVASVILGIRILIGMETRIMGVEGGKE